MNVNNKEKEEVLKNDILCASCIHREYCRGLNGPMWNRTKKRPQGTCDEYEKDSQVKIVKKFTK